MRRIPTKPNYSFIVPFHMRTFLAEQMLKFAVALLCCTLVDGMVTKQVINQVTWNPGAVLSDDAWINGTALDPSSVTRSLVMPNEVPLVGLASRMDGIRLSMRLSAMYTWTFIVLSAVALVLWWRMRPKLAEWVIPATYDASRRRFLVVWGLAIAADTLQSQHQVSLMSGYYLTWEQMWTLLQEGMATLFASTLIVGVLCDIFGRKRASAGVLVLRLISSAASHFGTLDALQLSMLTSCLATSMLHISFECWLVSEHQKRFGAWPAFLRHSFSQMFCLQTFIAIVILPLSQVVTKRVPLTEVGNRTFVGGHTLAFDGAAVCSLVALPLICLLWDENIGLDTRALRLPRTAVALDGCAVCLTMATFEGSVGGVLSCWVATACLDSTMSIQWWASGGCFLLACFCGTAGYGVWGAAENSRKLLERVLLISSLTLFIAWLCVGSSMELTVLFFSVVVFEVCAGVYFPAVCSVKADATDEATRGIVYGLLICSVFLALAYGSMYVCDIAKNVKFLPYLQPPADVEAM